MNNLNIGKYTPDQVMMTLSAITYTSFNSIGMLQDILNEAEALQQKYEAIWWATDQVNLIYVVKKTATKEYAIAIRGTVFPYGLAFLLKWYEDLDIAHQAPLPFCEVEKAKIGVGILNPILEIENLTYNGRSLHQMANNFAKGSKVYVTGHSLGGTLASAYAVMLVCSNLVELDIIPFTFAAPTAGNQTFADLFSSEGNHGLFSHSSRCVNSRDIIPCAWNDIKAMSAFDYSKLTCPLDFKLCLENICSLLIHSKVNYVQPPLHQKLLGRLESKDNYLEEAVYQHQPNTYLSLLGLDPIPSSSFYYERKNEEMLAATLYEFMDR